MVRVGGLHDQVDAGVDHRSPDGLTPGETIDAIARRVTDLDRRCSRLFSGELRPQLEQSGIRVLNCEDCSAEELRELDRHFAEEIFPVLTPLAVGPGRPFPYISNLSLSLAVWLRDPVTLNETFARVKVPKEVLPRFVQIGRSTFVPLEHVIARHLGELFPGMEVLRHSMFRVTRDADFTVSDEADDLLRAVEDELRRRRFGEVVRLEVGSDMDPDLRERMVSWLDVAQRQIYDVQGLLDYGDLWEIHRVEGHGDLRDPPWTPVQHPALVDKEREESDVFASMKRGDFLVHHPYQSFAGSVERFASQAVTDPDVLAIKLTVYRTSDD